MTTSTSTNALSTVELNPNYKIPLVLVLIGALLLIVQPLLAGIIALFGVFLMFQAVTLRLRFTATDLDIYRGEKLIRRFPYSEWQHWEIFWPQIPILFYFKETKSIHFLPIIFDPKTLKTCLEQHYPRNQNLG
ncbi:DUF3119 family protein [Mastigocoleus testarum]|uniref:Glycerol dehydrogenase n=1 Tax=Mastigocoleus testarum BC008 TaxID=371196 RepID=A0A0V7ZTB2_9CYAN|nr:DUF3119 family protein [Mastigocoleus testarum]KST67375.1 glycerol dehydrogenase [Mastigocoleus testarum BC008]